MYGQLHRVRLGELQRKWGEQFLLCVLHQADALPVLHDAFAKLRRVERVSCNLWFHHSVPHGDDVQQQLQLCDGNM